MELLGSAEGGANMSAMLDALQKTSGSDVGQLVNHFLNKSDQQSKVQENNQ